MLDFYGLLAIIMVLWTTFLAMFTALWLVRQISNVSYAVHLAPEPESYFYLYNWQTWELSDLLRYLVQHYFRFWVPTLISALVCVVLIASASWNG